MDNNIGSGEICAEYYESSCMTKYGEDGKHGVTDCQKIPVTLCGDKACQPVEGEKKCHEKVSALVLQGPKYTLNCHARKLACS